jgi:hypothetical protein
MVTGSLRAEAMTRRAARGGAAGPLMEGPLKALHL